MLSIRFLLPAVLLTASLSAAAAQAPEPAPDTVLLAFKHEAGKVQSFRADVSGDLALSPEGEGGAGGLGPVPFGLRMNVAYSEKVAGVKEGVGTLASTVTTMTVRTDAMGNQIVGKLANGKVTTTLNGRPVENAPGAVGSLRSLAAQSRSTMRRTPTGEVTLVSGIGNGVGQVTGAPSAVIAQFSPDPVRVGESWETVQKFRPGVSGTAPPGVTPPEVEVRLTHTLKSIEVKNGRRHALVETTGSGSTPEGSATSVSQNITGTTRFDIERGAVLSAQYDVDLSMKLSLAGLGQPAAPGLGGVIRIDGMLKIVLTEAPAAPAKPAPKKPAPRRRR